MTRAFSSTTASSTAPSSMSGMSCMSSMPGNTPNTMTHTHTRRTARPIVLAVGLALAAVLFPACGTPNRAAADASFNEAEAMRLATEAQIAQRNGRTDRAIDLYQQALRADENIAAAWHNLGTLLMEKKEFAAAAEAFKRAADLSPTDPRPYENLGLLYWESGWREESQRAFDIALERDENSLPALRGSAHWAKETGDFSDTTRERLRRALLIEKDPKWRAEFQRLLLRVEADLESQSKKKRPGDAAIPSAPAPDRSN
jgi:Tfp pilus assembly protein PilF